ncbi:endonuclease [bacterium (Candidatus Howlettbacteria) CG_4_10_14_0_8_um_filter_40_9]|nr:MAG: endonuclease [bacterium (Candidatus Howlettbacteria) CG_4_10_14_0_8_um_filter_40_9]
MFYTYILLSEKDGKHYIGSTGDLEDRLERHFSGRSKATKNRLPLRLVYKEEFETRKEALRREKQIKSYKGGNAFKKLINMGR